MSTKGLKRPDDPTHYRLANPGERVHISTMDGTLLRRVVSVLLILTFAVSVMGGHLAMARAMPSAGFPQLSGASGVHDPGPCDHGPAKAMVTADCKAMCGWQSAIVPASAIAVSSTVDSVWNLVGATRSVSGVKPDL